MEPNGESSMSDKVNSFESKILEVIAQEKTLPIVTIYGVLNLISSDMLNKASMARVMFSAGRK